MAETEVRVTVFERAMQLWPIGVACLGLSGFVYHLEGATTANGIAIVDLKDRVKTIEGGNSIGLQRLATVEEAVKGQNKTLDAQSNTLRDISAKLDRVLMGSRGR